MKQVLEGYIEERSGSSQEPHEAEGRLAFGDGEFSLVPERPLNKAGDHRGRPPGILTPEETQARVAARAALRPPTADAIAEEYKASSDVLHNDREPFYHIKHERPEHRVIAYLKAQGHPNVEISRITGFNVVTVSNVCRQPWARQLIISTMKELGRDAVQEILYSAAVDSVLKLEVLRDTATNENVQRQAANDLLNRVYGMPNQPITHREEVDLATLTDEELARIVSSGRKN